ncbi:MAG: DEAD/DEAH box helicase [Candidatus Caldatribacteriota bacterium]
MSKPINEAGSIFDVKWNEVYQNKDTQDLTNTIRAAIRINTAQSIKREIEKIVDDNKKIDRCKKLDGWQNEMLSKINRNNKDVYIISKPGSGKTAPVICYWKNKVLNIENKVDFFNYLLKPETMPQLLWLVPIKALSTNIVSDMKAIFAPIIVNLLLDKIESYTPTTAAEITLPQDVIDFINRFTKNIHKNINYYIKRTRDNYYIIENPQNATEFINILTEMIKTYIETVLVGKKEEGISDIQYKIGNNTFTKPVIISIYESAKSVIDKMDKLKLIVFDEAQRLQGSSPADLERAKEIGKSVYTTLHHSNADATKAKLILLSGSVHPETAQNATWFFNTFLNRTFDINPHVTPPHATNRSTINVYPMSRLNDFDTQIKIAKLVLSGQTSEKDSVIYVINGSKNSIDKIIDTLAPSAKTVITPPSRIDYISRNKNKDNKLKFDRNTIIDTVTNAGGINDISNDLLRRAVSHHIGFIYRPRGTISPADSRDMQIVQDLFKKKFIKIIFATDAIREGISLECKTMYLPSIENVVTKEKADLGSLVQLLHRIGRIPKINVNIYTDPKFVEDVRLALNAEPTDFEKMPFTIPPPNIQLKIGEEAAKTALIYTYEAMRTSSKFIVTKLRNHILFATLGKGLARLWHIN